MYLLRKHVWALLFLSAVTIAVYASGVAAYFCAQDDYVERHRAAFVDSQDPLRIVTTSHFGGMRYRPLNRAVNYLTYRFAGNDTEWYRIRNLSFHVINVLLVYAIGCLLLGSPGVAFAGALLFGTHPLAHQSVMGGAFWTNTMAYTTSLGSFALFLAAVRGRRHRKRRIGAAAFLIFLGILFYEPVVTVFGVMAGCLALYGLDREKPPHLSSLIRMFAFAAVVVVFLQMGFRTLLVSRTFERASASSTTAPRIAANLIIYLGALGQPVDPILVNSWFGTPLPSDLDLEDSYTFVIVAALVSAVVLPIVFYFFWHRLRNSAHSSHGPPFDWRRLLLLAAAIPVCLAPQLLFADHPSETYLYFPTALYALLLSYLFAYALRPRDGAVASSDSRVYWSLVAGMCVLGVYAIQVRSQRVVECGELAQRLEANFRRELAATGGSSVIVAPAPIPIPTPYGPYRLRGIEAISGKNSGHLTSALRLITHNAELTASLVEPQDLKVKCRQQGQADPICLQVFPDGRVERYLATIEVFRPGLTKNPRARNTPKRAHPG